MLQSPPSYGCGLGDDQLAQDISGFDGGIDLISGEKCEDGAMTMAGYQVRWLLAPRWGRIIHISFVVERVMLSAGGIIPDHWMSGSEVPAQGPAGAFEGYWRQRPKCG